MIYTKKTLNAICSLVVLILLTACGGSSRQPSPGPDNNNPKIEPGRVTMEALYGSPAAGIGLTNHSDRVEVQFTSIPNSGQFIKLIPGEGASLSPEATWSYAGNTSQGVLPLVLEADDGLEIGVVPLNSYDGAKVTLELDFITPGDGEYEPEVTATAEEVRLISIGNGKVKLSWTQSCTGDFNFDGIVDARDIVPIAKYFGLGYMTDQPGVNQQTAYWLDGDCDGKVSALDLQAIIDNYQSNVAGFIVNQNDEAIQGDGTEGVTIKSDQCIKRDGLPDKFSIVVEGNLSDEWSLEAVDADGDHGDPIPIAAEDLSIDLIANVTITGLGLNDVNNLIPDSDDPAKTGTRVIDPLEIIGSPVVAEAVHVTDNSFLFANLPRQKQLALDVLYLPVKDLKTGEDLIYIPDEMDTPELRKLVSSVIPFRLAESISGTAEMDVQISFESRTHGGYYVVVDTITSMPDGSTTFLHTALNYPEGKVKLDGDGDGNYAEEWEIVDDNRDGISNVWVEHVHRAELNLTGEPIDAIVSIVESNQKEGYVVVSSAEPLYPGENSLIVSDALQVYIDEMTNIDPEIDPWSPSPEKRYIMHIEQYSDQDSLDEVFYIAQDLVLFMEIPVDPDPNGPEDYKTVYGEVVEIGEDQLGVQDGEVRNVVRFDEYTLWFDEIGEIDSDDVKVGDFIQADLWLIDGQWIANVIELMDEPFNPGTDPQSWDPWPMCTVISIDQESMLLEYPGITFTCYYDEETFWHSDGGIIGPESIEPGDVVDVYAQMTQSGYKATMVFKHTDFPGPGDPGTNPDKPNNDPVDPVDPGDDPPVR